MNILMIADPHIPVPPSLYGGAERIVDLYARQLSKLGHTVHLLAASGSRSYGGQLSTHHPSGRSRLSRFHRKALFQAISLWAARKCDVVYNHGRSDYLDSLLLSGFPLLHRFPNPIQQGEVAAIEKRIRGPFGFHCISHSQHSSISFKTSSRVIPNPVDCNFYRPGTGNGGYLAFLGRLTHNKGVDVAIDVALTLNKPLIIAGNISSEPGGKAFFDQLIRPRIDGHLIRWIGPVNDMQKRQLLAEAEALLFPIRWDEPFGIVMVESLACGTPVIATQRASCPDVIDHGSTGYLCQPADPQVEIFAEAVSRLSKLDRNECRQAAMHRFDVSIIAPLVEEFLHQLVYK